MRRFATAAAGALLLAGLGVAVPAGPAAAQATLFEDDFSGGDGAWTTDGGNWQVTDQQTYLQDVDAGNARAFAGEDDWTDVAVTADVTVLPGTSLVAVLGRVQDVDTYYYLTLRYSGLFEINRLVGGSRLELAGIEVPVEVGTTYTLTLHQFGDELTGYLDGVPLLQATDDTFDTGPIGLKTFNATAEFDNVQVVEALGPGDPPEDPEEPEEPEEPEDPELPDTVVRPGDLPPLAKLVARQTLRAGDGWGSAGDGTTGGADAAPEQVHLVRNRAELVGALGGDNASNQTNDTSKIIFVQGAIDGFQDDGGELLSCDDFADPEYTFEDYLATYDPDVWGRDEDPSGPLEDARVRSLRNQQAHTVVNVGSNTTLIGLPGARLEQLTLMFNQVDNVIVRNITFEGAFDCFPRWRPTDGPDGNWNSEWDYVSVRRGSNFWFDHNTFQTSPEDLPEYFGRKYEVHDGQLDITHTANWVTVSQNVFKDHDKLMLIGSTNNPGGGDPGLLNVTLRHNVFDGIGQRAPRMRFGQIDVYNNYYQVAITALSYDFEYLWGVGVESQGYFQNNYVDLRGSGVAPSEVIFDWGGTVITERGTWVRTGHGIGRPMSLLDAYNAVNDPPLGDDAGWTPHLRNAPVLPAVAVPAVVGNLAGTGSLAILLLPI